ncbi:hypothetical protein E8E11_003634 [Didymella keratinophila]|nr:hypothetical protein E8E11_003634 [Didymella keratinophila]
MNASATIRASYVRATRMSMMPPPLPRPDSVTNTVADLESRPANSEKLKDFVPVNHLEHREKCDLERNKIYIYDEPYSPSYLEWEEAGSFSARLRKMYTVFPYRDPIWLVAVVFAFGSLDLVINAFFDLIPQLDEKLQFNTNETVAIPTTVLIGSMFFFVAGIFDTFGALNADRGTLDTNKETHKVTYRPALVGSPEFKWVPSWVKLWDLTMTNLAFQAGLIVLFGGVIFMFAGIVDFPELVPEEAPSFATIVFGPQVIHGALFLIANAMLAISEQERWYKPKWWDADWQGAFLNTLAESQVAIITGATSGIGLWLAERLYRRGYRVALCGRRMKEGTDAAKSLDPSSGSAIFVQCDVTSYESQAAMFQAVWTKWSRLDVLIANAGGLDGDSKYILRHRGVGVDALPPKPDTTCTDIDFKGVMYGTTLATHFMRHNPKSKCGKIIVTGSFLGVYGCATFPEYCAAKAAAHHYVRTAAPVLLQKENITINCVMPGPIVTDVVAGISDAFAPEHLTLKSVLLSAYDHFLEDKDNVKTGQLVGTAHKDLIFWPHPGYKKGAIFKRYEQTFDPWFNMIHGESSELPDALYEPVGSRGPKIIAVTGATGA